jgi:hypothetical protein
MVRLDRPDGCRSRERAKRITSCMALKIETDVKPENPKSNFIQAPF